MSDSEKPKKDPDAKPKFVVRTPTDVQRIKLQKLMANPTKEINIQPLQRKKSSDPSGAVPSFVRNVMGSSAGAGSGEFHVYRHLRRKEFARQKQIEHKSKQEEMDEAFENKLLQNQLQAEMRTAKKRAKRLKKKQKAKQRKLNPKSTAENEKSESSDEDSADEDDADTPVADKEATSDAKGEDSDVIVGPRPTETDDDSAKERVNRQEEGTDEDGKDQKDNSDGQSSS